MEQYPVLKMETSIRISVESGIKVSDKKCDKKPISRNVIFILHCFFSSSSRTTAKDLLLFRSLAINFLLYLPFILRTNFRMSSKSLGLLFNKVVSERRLELDNETLHVYCRHLTCVFSSAIFPRNRPCLKIRFVSPFFP